MVRVVAATYNAHRFARGVRAAADLFEEPSPDLLLVQEAGSRRHTRRFARSMGMEFVSSHRPFRRVRNAVLFRPPWRLIEAHATDLSRGERTLPRGFVAARLRAGPARL